MVSRIKTSPKFTVFTPTHNRAHTLPKVFESLLAQTFRDFEWVIVDNGSKDDTAQLVESWAANSPFEIRYHPQDDRGKHVAVNRGVSMARGEFFVILDSDDWFAKDTLELMLSTWETVPSRERDGFAGAVGLCYYENSTVIGDPFPIQGTYLDCDALDLKWKYKVHGDKISMIRTDVMREYPFPFEDVRGVVSEQLVWNRMAERYRSRHVNQNWCFKEYQTGGLTDRALELQVKAARATRQIHLESLMRRRRAPLRDHIRSVCNYVRFSFHAGVSLNRQAREVRMSPGWFALLPVGVALYFKDRRRLAGGNSGRPKPPKSPLVGAP
jgi:glycosyltransferase involved in cell wall biosynthesis